MRINGSIRKLLDNVIVWSGPFFTLNIKLPLNFIRSILIIMQRYTNCLCLLFSIVFLLLVHECMTAGMSFNANQKYAYVGKTQVNIASQIKAINSSDWSRGPIIITIPYPAAFNSPLIGAAALIGQVQHVDLYFIISVFVEKLQVNATQLSVKIFSLNASNIIKLSISYMVYYNYTQYSTNIYVEQLYTDFNGTGRNISSNPLTFFNTSYTPDNYINSTGVKKVVLMLSGLDAQATAITVTYDIALIGSYSSLGTIIINITSTSLNATFLGDILITVFVYNDNYVNSPLSKIYNIRSGTTSNMYANSSLEMTSFNTLVGLTAFSISYQKTFSFFQDFSNPNQFYISIFNTYASSIFSYIVIYSYYCDYTTPYYESVTKSCYSTCPGNSTSDDLSLSCLCHINGAVVNNSNCVQNISQNIIPNTTQNISQDTTPNNTQNNTQNNTPNNTQNNTQNITILNSISESSSNGISLVVIVCIAVGVGVGVIIFIIACIMCRNKNDQKIKSGDGNKEKKSSDSNGTIQGQVKIKSSISVSQFDSPANSNNPMVKPYNPYPSITISKSPRISRRREKWLESQKNHSGDDICCICLLNRTFVESQCSHYFHFTCLMRVTRLHRGCPICRNELADNVKYFCNGCNQKYRKISIKDDIDMDSFQNYCNQCSQIPF